MQHHLYIKYINDFFIRDLELFKEPSYCKLEYRLYDEKLL